MRPERIISGGQTGADQGALLAAEALHIPMGGWMPKGFKTEHGPRPDIAKRFHLAEHESADYNARTEQNVLDSDGTLWVGNTDSPGFRATRRFAMTRGKPWLENPGVEELRAWTEAWEIRTLNCAGNRASGRPGVMTAMMDLLLEAFYA